MITESFDNKTEPILGLRDFYGVQKHLIDVCLIIFSREIYDTVLETYECEKIGAIQAANGESPIYKFNYNGNEVGFYLTAIGSTVASQYAIEANWLTGASKFIMFGSAGSLDGEKTTGKYVLPIQAYRDEGMSYHYAPPTDYIDIKNAKKMAEYFEKLGLPYIEGRVWTTDAFLRETVGQIEKRTREGCIAVEMELAGVQSVCDFYGMELYNFLVTGDVLSTEDYDKSGLSDANHNMEKFYIALKLSELVR